MKRLAIFTAVLTAILACVAPTGALADRTVAPGSEHRLVLPGVASPPRAVPKRIQRMAPRAGLAHHRTRSLSYLDPSGRIDSLAYCQEVGGLQQMNPDGTIYTTPGYWHASTSHPYRVLPTISGSQWVAFKITGQASNGTVPAQSDWFWGVATSPAGYFRNLYDPTVGAYLFENARTGQRVRIVNLDLRPNKPYGVRYRMDVAWYTNGALTRTQAITVPWTSGNVGAYCWA